MIALIIFIASGLWLILIAIICDAGSSSGKVAADTRDKGEEVKRMEGRLSEIAIELMVNKKLAAIEERCKLLKHEIEQSFDIVYRDIRILSGEVKLRKDLNDRFLALLRHLGLSATLHRQPEVEEYRIERADRGKEKKVCS